MVEPFDDGSIRFTPVNTKGEANYIPNPESIPDGTRCGNCAHFIDGGGCHVVQGEIDPGAVCTEFYADVGIFADNTFKDPVSMVLERGRVAEWTDADLVRFLNVAREALEARQGRQSD